MTDNACYVGVTAANV